MRLPAGLLAAIGGQLAGAPRDFAAGWLDGRTRYRNAADKRRPANSWFDRGTLGYAASCAAVAFYQALDGYDLAEGD